MNELELVLLDWIQQAFRSSFGDAFFPWITHLGDAGAIWIALTIVLLVLPRTRRTGFALALALLVDLILCNLLLKPLVARVRPFDWNPDVLLLVARPMDFSFPSGHTAASFAAAGTLLFRRSKLAIPALLLAVLIAFSRLYLYLHYPTDVLGGIVVGLTAAFAGVWVQKKLEQNRKWNR